MQTCQSCMFVREITMPGAIQKSPICCKNPPVAMAINSNQGMQVVGMQPPIPQSQICGEWRGTLRDTFVDNVPGKLLPPTK